MSEHKRKDGVSSKRKYTIRSKCMNYGNHKEKYDEINMTFKLFFIFILDGRIMLVKFNKDEWNGPCPKPQQGCLMESD